MSTAPEQGVEIQPSIGGGRSSTGKFDAKKCSYHKELHLGVKLGKMKFDGKFDAPAKHRRTSGAEFTGPSAASNFEFAVQRQKPQNRDKYLTHL
jgi:hypothetical protein